MQLSRISRRLCSLAERDTQIFSILQNEQRRQWEGLELIASENFTSKAVLDALGSAFTNKYSEGLPGARYYGGNEYIDEVERIAQQRALHAFNLESKHWGVNVQPYSGSVGNLAAFLSVLQPNDRFMGLGLASGGHLSHGHYVGQRKINVSSVIFQSFPYHVSPETGEVDYDDLERNALVYQPKLIVAGGSAYPRDWDYERMRSIADKVKAFLLVDMAHFSGLVAGGAVRSPFKHAHIVTTTTHKSLRGPRGAMIFFSKADGLDLEKKVNSAVFPCVQGGPHNNAIAAIAVQLKEAMSDEFRAYSRQVVTNAKALGESLMEKGHSLVSGGTDTHLVLWDLRPHGLTGSKYETLCEAVAITVNKNSVYGDTNAVAPGGVRIGTPALTSRGFTEEDFREVAEFLHKALEISVKINKTSGKMLKDFKAALENDSDVKDLRKNVTEFAQKFPIPGFKVE